VKESRKLFGIWRRYGQGYRVARFSTHTAVVVGFLGRCVAILCDTRLARVRHCRRTLLYELVSGEFPWRGLRPEEMMWLVMNGERQSLTTLGCNSVLKVKIYFYSVFLLWDPLRYSLCTSVWSFPSLPLTRDKKLKKSKADSEGCPHCMQLTGEFQDRQVKSQGHKTTNTRTQKGL